MTGIAPSVRELELILTSRCNLKCSYCFENDKQDLRMSWDVVEAALDRVLASPERAPTVLFFGGEPTLEFPTIRRAVAYVLERRPSWKRFRWAINTNGTLLGPEEVRFLAEHRFTVQVSMDGIPEAQIFRGRGTFEQLDRLLDVLRTTEPRFFKRNVSVSMTVLPRTIRYLAASVDYLLGKGVSEIGLSPKLTFDPHWDNAMVAELDRQFGAVFQSSVAHFRRKGSVPLTLFRKPPVRVRRARPARLAMCGVGSGTQIAVDVDGTTHGCAMFARSYQKFPSEFLRTKLHAIEMGDVRDPDLDTRRARFPAALAKTEIFHDKQDKYSSLRRCADCRFLADCAICPTAIGHIPGNTDPRRVPDFLCAFSYVSLSYRARFPVSRPPSLAALRRDAAAIRAHALVTRLLGGR